MKRRKKSILFSATLATAGLVAGSLVAINNSTNAEVVTLEGVETLLSKKLNISVESVKTSLEAKQIFVEVEDESVLSGLKHGNIIGNFYSVSFDSAMDTGNGYISLSENDSVNSIALSHPVHLSRTTPSVSSNASYGVGMMALDKYADSLSSSTNTVEVAVLDSGIRATHEIFSESSSQDRLNLSKARGYVNAYVDDDDNCTGWNTYYTDDNTHGTMVSGLIAQSTPKNVKIIPIKVMGASGTSDSPWPLICGALYASQVADVVNMSLGMKQSDLEQEAMEWYDGFFEELENRFGAIFVAAAGNDYLDTIDYPAAAPNVIAATSIDANKNHSAYSNTGERADFATPGQNMKLPCRTSDTCYDTKSGTSFSSPLLAAAVADILMEYPSYTRTEIEAMLKMNAEDLGTPGWDATFGYGAVNFSINKFADINFETVQPGLVWAQSSNVTVKVSSSKYNIVKYALLAGDIATLPTTWKDVTTAGKTINETYPIANNGVYTLWYKNSNNEYKRKTFEVLNIDKVAPTIQTALNVSKESDNSEKLALAASDDASGLGKIEWYFKLSTSTEYTMVSDTCLGEKSSTAKSRVIGSLVPGTYNAYAVVYDRAGNSVRTGNVNFVIEAPADHVTIGNPVVPTSWIKTSANITVFVSSDLSNITHRAIISGNSTAEPAASEWKVLSAAGQEMNDTFTIESNGTYTVWYKNNTESAHKTFTVNKIDKGAPTVEDIEVSNLTSSSAKLSLKVGDDLSGIAKIDWKYKLLSDSSYTTKTTTYSDGATAATVKSYSISGLSVGNYVVYATVYDVAGNSKSSGEINFEIEEGIVSDVLSIDNVQVQETWGKNNEVKVTVSSETTNITHSALIEGNSTSEPAASAWKAVSSPSKQLTDTITITANGTYTVWYKNEGGSIDHSSFTINKIDMAAPVVQEELSASEITKNSVTLSIKVDDAASGISRIDWYYKLDGAEGFGVETDTFLKSLVETLDLSANTHTFTDLAPGNYVAYAKITDRVGNSFTTGQITFTILGEEDDDDDDNDNPGGNAQDAGDTAENPKTGDDIAIIYTISGALLAAGACAATRLRRIR